MVLTFLCLLVYLFAMTYYHEGWPFYRLTQIYPQVDIGKIQMSQQRIWLSFLTVYVNRIPQLYYGVEILLNGTKTQSDGNVRQDFPGGFPGDNHNAFTADRRTDAENGMFRWLSRLLHWRQGNDVITKGTMTQFIPHRGIYVVARQYKGKTVMTILNGTPYAATLPVSRYAEVIGNHRLARNFFCDSTIDLTKDIQLQPRESLIIEF